MRPATGAARPPLTWNLLHGAPSDTVVAADWAERMTPDWAWDGATGRGVRVCILDSGVEADHPMVGPVQGSYQVTATASGSLGVEETALADTCGHGTACASIVRSLAPDCEIHSVQVLNRFSGSGDSLITGLRWAIDQGFDVVNMSLSTTKRQYVQALHALADDAFFRGTILVASAHNMPVESFPWRFASVISVGSHAESDPRLILYNPTPPVEFFASGTDVVAGWAGGSRTKVSGNSFATPHVTGHCALALSKHPRLTPFQMKSMLYLTSGNVRDRANGRNDST